MPYCLKLGLNCSIINNVMAFSQGAITLYIQYRWVLVSHFLLQPATEEIVMPTETTILTILGIVFFLLWLCFMFLYNAQKRKEDEHRKTIGKLKEELFTAREDNKELYYELEEKADVIKAQADVIAKLKTDYAEEILRERRSKLCETEKMQEECDARIEAENEKYRALEKEYQEFQDSCKLGEYMISEHEGLRIELEQKVKLLTAENKKLKSMLAEYDDQ